MESIKSTINVIKGIIISNGNNKGATMVHSERHLLMPNGIKLSDDSEIEVTKIYFNKFNDGHEQLAIEQGNMYWISLNKLSQEKLFKLCVSLCVLYGVEFEF